MADSVPPFTSDATFVCCVNKCKTYKTYLLTKCLWGIEGHI